MSEPPKYSMRIYFDRAGGHTHMNIWTGPIGRTHGKAGDLCLTNDEFEEWQKGNIKMEFKNANLAKGEG